MVHAQILAQRYRSILEENKKLVRPGRQNGEGVVGGGLARPPLSLTGGQRRAVSSTQWPLARWPSLTETFSAHYSDPTTGVVASGDEEDLHIYQWFCPQCERRQ